MKVQSAAELRGELEEAALLNFPTTSRFGHFSLDQKRDLFARRGDLLPRLLILFLDFQEKWETVKQAPLSLVFPFWIEVGDITVFFDANKALAHEWLLPFARTDNGFVLAFWT